MKLFKESEDSELYQLHGLTENQLIGLFNVCINYKTSLSQILKLSDKELLKVAPGLDAKTVRFNLKIQDDACNEFINMWKIAINANNKPDKNKN